MNFFQQFKKIFPEVFGNQKAKLALFLNIVEPRCGGVLIAGRKGTGKSLLIKCFKKFLKIAKLPFVEIPLGVTEEALVGGIDIEKTIEKGKKIFEEGLLHRGKNGFVLIDDINLFPEEYLGLIFEKGESFNLVATLNPEEGFLSDHFLDRFGLCAFTEPLKGLEEKTELLKLYENFYHFEALFLKDYKELVKQIEILKALKSKVRVGDFIWDKVVETVLKELVFSHRAEIFLFYASIAYATLKGEFYLNENHVDEISSLVLIHRKKEIEKKEVPKEQENKKDKEDKKENSQPHQPQRDNNVPKQKENFSKGDFNELNKNDDISQFEINLPSISKEEVFDVGEVFKPKRLIFRKDRIIRNIIGRRTKSKTKLKGGRFLRSVDFTEDKDLDVFGTIKTAAPFQILRGKKDRLIIYEEDFRYKEKERKIGHFVIFVVDGSGSMGVQERMKAVKGAIVSLLMDCYQKRDKVSMIMFRKDQAEVILPPTSSVELAYKKLKDLPTGGKTPLSLGLLKAYEVAKKFHLKHPEARVILVVLSDGKANVSLKEKNPLDETKRICEEIRKLTYIDSVVVDCEIKKNFLKMDLAMDLAKWLSGRYFLLEELKAESLVRMINKMKTVS